MPGLRDGDVVDAATSAATLSAVVGVGVCVAVVVGVAAPVASVPSVAEVGVVVAWADGVGAGVEEAVVAAATTAVGDDALRALILLPVSMPMSTCTKTKWYQALQT